ncbi:MAG TPA: hypothetical protein VFE07_16685 [Marmoricola sp.]|nr:hypothetical protein [Marmoricola sp.]
MTGNRRDDEDRRGELATVVLKVVGVAVAIGLVIGIGAWVLVKAIGLDSPDPATDPSQVQPVTPLPSTALPVPSESDTSGPGTSDLPTITPSPGNGDLFLSAAPVIVDPMERINLTGQWPGHDNEGLLVQRFEGGKWADFGVQVRVNVGTFETYVMTGRSGDQRFRVYDPQSRTASNEVTVTVGS